MGEQLRRAARTKPHDRTLFATNVRDATHAEVANAAKLLHFMITCVGPRGLTSVSVRHECLRVSSMKRWWAAAALVLACAVSVQSLLDDQAQLVTEVDHSSLDTFLDEHPTAVVEFYAPVCVNVVVSVCGKLILAFYAPRCVVCVCVCVWRPLQWCSVCKKLAPEVEQLASLVAEHGLDVAVAKGNANEDHILKERFDVQRTPKFIFFRNGVAHAFKTFRSGEAMFSKVLATLQPDAPPFSPAKQFSDPMKLTEWLFWRGTDGGRLEPAAVLFQPVVEERTSDELVSAFHEFAIANVLKMRFAVVTGEDVLQLFRMDPDHATVALYTEHDEGKHVFVGQPNKLGAFLLARLVPLVVPVDHITLLKVSRSTPLLVHLFVSTSDLAERKAHVLEQVRTKLGLLPWAQLPGTHCCSV